MPKDFIPRGAFQTEATRFLLEHDRANLHIECGLGKTIAVLNAIDVLILCGESKPFLVIAPLRVARSTWSDECRKWNHLSHLKVSPIVGTPKERLAALNTEAHIYTTNYENLEWLVGQVGDKWPFRTIIADESTRLKSHRACFVKSKNGGTHLRCSGGKRSAAIARLAFTKTRRFWALTGTPAPNGLQDLYGPCWFIDKGASLGSSYTAFEERWYRKSFNGFTMEMLPHAEEEIRKAIEPYTFTLRASDYLNLGEELTNNIFIDLPPSARKIYGEMERNLYIEIKAGEVEAFSAATKSVKIRQIANGAVYYDDKQSYEIIHDEKIEALRSVVEEAGCTPILVAYHFKSDLERLKKAFPQGRAFDTKPKTEADFKAGKIPILFIHPASGGHGIDSFQYVTNIIVFFSLDWSSENRLQVIGRIGAVRQAQAGFDRPVYIHNIVCRDSIDEDILLRIESKISVEEALKSGLARRGLK